MLLTARLEGGLPGAVNRTIYLRAQYFRLISGRIPAVNEIKIFGGYEISILSRKKQNVELVKFRVLDKAIN